MDRDGTTPWYGNISGPGNGPALIGGTTVSPTTTGIQDIFNPHGSTGSMEVGDTQIIDTSIIKNLANNGDYMPIFSTVIGQELSQFSSANLYLRCMVDFMSNSIGTNAPYLMHLGFPAVNASDELRSFGTPATRLGRPTDGSN